MTWKWINWLNLLLQTDICAIFLTSDLYSMQIRILHNKAFKTFLRILKWNWQLMTKMFTCGHTTLLYGLTRPAIKLNNMRKLCLFCERFPIFNKSFKWCQIWNSRTQFPTQSLTISINLRKGLIRAKVKWKLYYKWQFLTKIWNIQFVPLLLPLFQLFVENTKSTVQPTSIIIIKWTDNHENSCSLPGGFTLIIRIDFYVKLTYKCYDMASILTIVLHCIQPDAATKLKYQNDLW